MTLWTEFDKEKEKVGLAGCGRMGVCMLKRILDAGYRICVYDIMPDVLQAIKDMGAEPMSTPAEMANQASVILMSLPGPAQLEEVLFGKHGMASALNEQHIVVDTSTVDPETTRANAARIGEYGAVYLDSPILGRPSAAGKWMLPTGGGNGAENALERIKPILLTFASNAILVGGSGAGNALKLLNQMMFSCINAVSAEVMAICDNVGIDREVFYNTVASSSAATVSGLFREVGANIVSESYCSPAFTVDLLIKDAELALEMARSAKSPSVIAGTTQLYNEIARSQGLGTQDTSALYKVFRGHYRSLE